MTNAQIEYLKHKETQTHNREMERQGREDIASRRLQAEAAGSQARSSAAGVPAQYLKALIGSTGTGLVLKGVGDAIRAAREKKRIDGMFKAASKVKETAAAIPSTASIIARFKTALSRVQPGIFVDYSEIAKGLDTFAEERKQIADWLEANPNASPDEYMEQVRKIKSLSKERKTRNEN